ncbi:hypothetical protein ACLOJK_005230 [Asimina triloba]
MYITFFLSLKLGSARAVNRRYISDCVPLKIRMQASAGFVSASALGMACGPALAGLLQTHFKIFQLTFNEDTLPGWVMALAWLIYLIFLWFSFKEPVRNNEDNFLPQDRVANPGSVESAELGKAISQPLLLGSEENQNDEDGEQGSEDTTEESNKPASSVAAAYRLLTPTVKYVSSALLTFVSAEVLEGVNLSLLSRVMSSRLACGTYNGGLLSTEAGTLARVVADGTVTLAGFLGVDKLLNVTLEGRP